MTRNIILILLFVSMGVSQHYDRPANFSRQISHFEVDAYELYASDLVYSSPDKDGLRIPIYRIESFQGQFFKMVDIDSGIMLNTYVAGENIHFSKYGKYWAINFNTDNGSNTIYGYGSEGPIEQHRSEIFDEGEMLEICELNSQYLTLYSQQTFNCYTLDGTLNWSYRYPYGDLSSDNVFLTSDETILVINIPGDRVNALDMLTGEQVWKFEGKYSARPIPYDLNSNVILFDQSYGKAGIINRTGKKLYELDKPNDLVGQSFVYEKRLVSGSLVIPDLAREERRVRLPSNLTSGGNRAVTPITWSTEGTYFAIVYSYMERREPPDSTAERYRIDVVSADGRDMGYFYPRIRDKLDHSKIQVQISNEGSEVLLIGRQRDGVQFIYREYSISL